MAEQKCDYQFKLVLLGETCVGKTSLLIRFADDGYSEFHITTIGVDFRYRTVECEGKNVKLQIWDTAGQEKFRTIIPAYYRGADGVIFVYDVTSSESFQHVEEWLTDVDNHAEKDPAKFLVGNKADLTDQRQVPEEVAQRFADEHNLSFIEASAKTATNVQAAFMSLTKELIKRATPIVSSPPPIGGGKVKLGAGGGSDGGDNSKCC